MATADTASLSNDPDDAPLYESRKNICPSSVNGTFRQIKWVVLLITLSIYYFLPFVRWDRGSAAPSQAVIIDFTEKKFYFFFIELWPQEVYFFTGLLVLAAFTLFLMNAVAGRLWCGYLCPQTVWTDLFLMIERLCEGDRRERLKAMECPWTVKRTLRAAAKHFLWLMVAWWTGGAWVLYFDDAPTLVYKLATFQADFVAYMWIGILTLTTYTLAGHAREQVCIYMCPWPRIQAALTDEQALLVSYRYDRGEPRGSLKDNAKLKASGERAGDCIDCDQCVHVCPTGVDIRKGFQLDCIQCGLCIDACDTVMRKINKPTGLIGYDTDENIKRREQGLAEEPIHLVRPRTILYAALIAAVGGVMLYALLTRELLGVNVQHDRNPVSVTLADGSVRNAYTMHILNKRGEPRLVVVEVEGLPQRQLEIVGQDQLKGGIVYLDVEANATRDARLLITVPKGQVPAKSTPITIRLRDVRFNETAYKSEHFFDKQ
jgi:cytochrome c oxidase accessory protein FixG